MSDNNENTPAEKESRIYHCGMCGRSSENPGDFTVRETFGGKMNLCESCDIHMKNERMLSGEDPNIAGALLVGGIASLGCVAVLYYLDLLFGFRPGGIAAVAVGWIVGRAVLSGAENNRGLPVQVTAVVLTIMTVLMSAYLIVNRHANEEAASPDGWLSPVDFFVRYFEHLRSGGIASEIIFFVVALITAASVTGMKRSDTVDYTERVKEGASDG